MDQKSRDISENTIAIIAGNLLAGRDRYMNGEEDDEAVRWAVGIARAIMDEVRRQTKPRESPR